MIHRFQNNFLKRLLTVSALTPIFLITGNLGAQNPTPQKWPNYFQPELLHLSLILPPPPKQGSAQDRREMKYVLHLQQTRTLDEIALAQADDQEEDIFIFRDVLGRNFTADKLPFTAIFCAPQERLRNSRSAVEAFLSTATTVCFEFGGTSGLQAQ